MRPVELLYQYRVPDWVVRQAIRWILGRSTRRWHRMPAAEQEAHRRALIQELRRSPIAIRTDDANRQHYEVPPSFFELVLGPWLKYSCCYWPEGVETLEQAEEAMLQLTCERARLEDGMRVLDLGCGWGSLSFWIAKHYPCSQVTALSNSKAQIGHIEDQCAQRGLDKVKAIVGDVRDLSLDEAFDLVVSIEMFEHMKNYERLMARIAPLLKPGGKLFVHIFSHRQFAFEFEADDSDDWMAQTFFSGGTMPSDDLLLHFQRDLCIVDHWRLGGLHYARTLRAWLEKMDRNQSAVRKVLEAAYGAAETSRRVVDWRLFFIACEETWALRQGREYMVSHYLFDRRRPKPPSSPGPSL